MASTQDVPSMAVDVVDWVGDDTDRAKAAWVAEHNRANPRKTVVEHLTDLVDDVDDQDAHDTEVDQASGWLAAVADDCLVGRHDGQRMVDQAERLAVDSDPAVRAEARKVRSAGRRLRSASESLREAAREFDAARAGADVVG